MKQEEESSRKGETESEREKQLKVNSLSVAQGRTLKGGEQQRVCEVFLGLAV